MHSYTLFSFILTIAIVIAYCNHRFIRMQSTIAIMVASLLISVCLMLLEHTGFSAITNNARHLLLQTHFQDLLIKGMLGFLLFAGALSIDILSFKSRKWEIAL